MKLAHKLNQKATGATGKSPVAPAVPPSQEILDMLTKAAEAKQLGCSIPRIKLSPANVKWLVQEGFRVSQPRTIDPKATVMVSWRFKDGQRTEVGQDPKATAVSFKAPQPKPAP